MKKKILIFTTGGTIDKSYNEIDGSIMNHETIIRELILTKLRLPYTEIEIHEIMAKDSLEMTDSDREVILNTINKNARPDTPILIIHGTDTMAKSLCYCYERSKKLLCPIIFTGAMRPAVMADSDALQNITEALISAKLLGPGFYISFHGEIFSAPKVQKNRTRGTFEHI